MWARHRLEWIIALVSAALAGGYLLAPPMGSDLAAQTARAAFFAAHGYTPIDLRWYSGVDQLGYSLVSQPVMAVLGVRVTGALTLVAGAVLLTVLLRRTAAERPALGAALGVLAVAGNLISGRVTYGLGVCFGLAALVALTQAARFRWIAGLFAALTSATSPVAGLFLGLAAAALLLSGWLPRVSRPAPDTPEHQPRRTPTLTGWLPRVSRPGPDTPRVQPERWGGALAVGAGAAVPLAASVLLFGDGGWMNISRTDTLHAVVTGLVVALLVPVRPIRIGALLSSAGVLASALIHTPVGLNATRLAVMFALPVLAGYVRLSPRIVPALLVITFWWQPPIVTNDVRDIGNPTAEAGYFTPLRDRLARETLTGRLEIPSTRDYWEAARMGDVPLARGWLRQADIDRNPLFFTTVPGASGTGVALTTESYRTWLTERAVQFVAVPDAELAWPGSAEAALIAAGLPYLTEVWSGEHWRLYRVSEPAPIVAAPAALVRQTAAAITLDAPAAGDIPLRVHWYRWLRATGGAEVVRDGDGVVLRVPAAGRYTLSS
ncbi:hypothetical protein [Actinoplanes sp. NPDC051851]|uniref:hypothetical protein n=1 Tax=Actinoplanes sp. NPDC051851 TaxID=3154753 RepID=UPI00343946D2